MNGRPSEEEPAGPKTRLVYFAVRFPVLSQTFIQREVAGLRDAGLEVEVHPGLPSDAESWAAATVREGVMRPGLSLWLGGTLAVFGWWLRRPTVVHGLLRELVAVRSGTVEQLFHTVLGLVLGARAAWDGQRSAYHGCWATAPATAAWVASRLTGQAFGFGAHAYDVFRDGGDPLLRVKLREAVWVHSSTEATKMELIRREPGCASKLVVVRRGLVEFPAWREPEKVEGRELRVASVGRLVRKKGLRHQVEACAELCRTGVAVRWRVIGDGPMRTELERATREWGVAGVFQWEGARPESEVWALYRWADVFVFSGEVAEDGDRDGLPNVIPEAMAAGVPVVTSAVAGALEAVTEGVTGRVVEPLSGVSLARVLGELGADWGVRVALARAAREWVETHYSAKVNAGRLARAIVEGCACSGNQAG